MENHPDLQADAEMHGKAIGHYKKCPLHSYGPTPVERSVRMHPSLNFTCNLLRVLACAERYTSGIVFTSSSFIKNRNCVILQTFFVIKTIHHQFCCCFAQGSTCWRVLKGTPLASCLPALVLSKIVIVSFSRLLS